MRESLAATLASARTAYRQCLLSSKSPERREKARQPHAAVGRCLDTVDRAAQFRADLDRVATQGTAQFVVVIAAQKQPFAAIDASFPSR
jgi:hypothetical protein